MSPVVGKSLPVAIAALIGAGALYLWKSQPPAPGASTQPPPPVRHAQGARHNPAPAGLTSLNDPGQAWQARIDILRNTLQAECGEREIRYLYELLAGGPPKGELPEHWYVMANEYMEQLRLHDSDAQRFSSSLLRLLHDPQQPLVLRDYAVQHLVT